MARRVIRPALLWSVSLVLSSPYFACERRDDSAAKSATQTVQNTHAEAATPRDTPRGAGVPFEVGDSPDIRELEKVDLAQYVAGEPWCTKARGGRRAHFAAGGDFVEAGGDGAGEKRGTWQVSEGRLTITTPGEQARNVDARAASVNGKQVLLLDGLLYGRCAEP